MPPWSLQQLNLILVEPAGPLNVGSVARVMKNMGLTQLVLVNPRCHLQDPLARQMAVHGADILDQARVVGSLGEALTGCQRVVATTGRQQPQAQRLEWPEAVLPWLLPTNPQEQLRSALIFGPEDRGLSNEELIQAQRWIRIPTSDTYPSLNLAQAVAVCSYLLHRLAVTAPSPVSRPADPPADWQQRQGFCQDLEAILLKIGYLYPHTAAPRMAKLRQLLDRSDPNSQELAMLRGVLRQINWALARGQDRP
jgi:tRNA/rRNA methyltransferase